jgi:hypothetical protein
MHHLPNSSYLSWQLNQLFLHQMRHLLQGLYGLLLSICVHARCTITLSFFEYFNPVWEDAIVSKIEEKVSGLTKYDISSVTSNS